MELEQVVSAEQPIETYTAEREIPVSAMYRATLRRRTAAQAMLVLFYLLAAGLFWSLGNSPILTGALLGVAAITLITMLTIRVSVNAAVKKTPAGSVTLYEAFPDRLRLTGITDGAEDVRYTIDADTERQVFRCKEGMVLSAKGRLAGLRHETLAAHPAIASYFTPSEQQKKSDANRPFSALRWVFLFAVLGANVFFLHYADQIANGALRLTLETALILLLLGFSVSFFFLKGKIKLFWLYGVLGVLCAALLAFQTVLIEWRMADPSPAQQIAYEDGYDYEYGYDYGYDYDEPDSVNYTEVLAYAYSLGLTLPQSGDTMIWYCVPAQENGLVLEASVLYGSRDAKAFEQTIASDARWRQTLPSALIGAVHPYFSIGDVSLLYNLDTGEYNTVPAESGTYRFVFLTYWRDNGELVLADYQLAWTAE